MGVTQDKTKPITYQKAACLIKKIGSIKNAWDGHPVLNRNAGGTFRANKIKNWVFDDNVKGLMFWYCLDGDDFFLALEPWKEEYDESSIQAKRPLAKNLYVPKKLLKENLYDRENLADELPVFKDSVINWQKTRSREIVTAWVENYINFMKDKNNEDFSPYSFFVGWEKNVNYLRNFFNEKSPRNLRYFFSYDEVEKPYSLRVILAPVNRWGKNIYKINEKAAVRDDVLQYSWPPKPATET